MKSVSAVFPSGFSGGKLYEYWVREGDEPKVNDFIVTSLGNAEKPVNIARIVEVNAVASELATKPYLLLLPLTTLQDRTASIKADAERARLREAAVKRLKQLAEAKALIDSLRNSTDPEIVALIKSIEG